jgi:hypothetical protein
MKAVWYVQANSLTHLSQDYRRQRHLDLLISYGQKTVLAVLIHNLAAIDQSNRI